MQSVNLECNTEPGFYAEYPQFPYRTGDLTFTVDAPLTSDWVVAGQTTFHAFQTRTPVERRVLVVMEPHGYFPASYINQFGIVISPFAIPAHRGIWVQDHGGLPSFFNTDHGVSPWRPVYDNADLRDLPVPEKQDRASVVISSKTRLRGHRRRLAFVRRFKARIGDRLAVYGRGFNWVPRKDEVVLPFKYHIVLENTQMPFYWTEKIADAFLGYAFPFVAGPPNLERWFPKESFEPIDLTRPDAAVDKVVSLMDAGIFEDRLPAIKVARRRVLDEERFCHVVARAIAAHPSAAPRLASPVTIRPAGKPNALYRISREAARFYWKIDDRLRR
jgi:hypothetical protein